MSKNTNLSFLTDYITADITNGRIGINNASPAYAFDVTGIARTSTSTYLATASGNVGIGTTSPSTKLHVYEALTNASAHLTIQNNRARNAAVYTQTTNGGFYAGTSIGTDTFNYQIYDGVAGAARLTIASTGAATFSSSVTMGGDLVLTPTDSAISFSSGAARFFTGGSERMRITSAGNVGIGTSSPSYKLQVNGNGYFGSGLTVEGSIYATSLVLTAAINTYNVAQFVVSNSYSFTPPNMLSASSNDGELKMYMVWVWGANTAIYGGVRVWMIAVSGPGTAYTVNTLLSRDVGGGTGLDLTRTSATQLTITSNNLAAIKWVSIMQLNTNT